MKYDGDLATPRYAFHIVKTVASEGLERFLAMGGYHGSDSVEEFDPDTLTWTPAPANLLEERGLYSVTAIERNLIC